MAPARPRNTRAARPERPSVASPPVWTARQHRWLLLVPALALLLRLLHAWGQARHNPFFFAPTMDEEMHHTWAKQIAAGAGLGSKPYFRSPLYYYLLAALYTVIGPSVLAGRLVGILIGSASCYLIARLGVCLADFPVGLLAGVIAAVYWPLIHFDNLLLTVGVEVFLNLVVLLLLIRARRRAALGLFGLAGIVWGLSALARPTILTLAPGVLLWIALATGTTLTPRRRGLAMVLVCAGAALVILPVTLRNRIVGGEWVLIATNGGVNFYIGNNPESDGIAAIVPGTRATWEGGYEDTHRIAEQALGRPLSENDVSRYWFRRGLAWIATDPLEWVRLTAHKARLFWSPLELPNNQPIDDFMRLSESSVLYWIGFPVIACLGVAALPLIRTNWRDWSLLLLFAGLYIATIVLFFCPARYRLPIAPLLILLAANGLVQLFPAWRARQLPRLLASALLVPLMAVFLWTNPPDRTVQRRMSAGMAHYNLGLHYTWAAKDDPTQRPVAVTHLRRAVELRPTDPAPRRSLGLALARGGEWTAAAEQFAAVVALDPNDVESELTLAQCQQELGLADAAAQIYRRIVARQPRADALTQLGILAAQQGDLTAAAKDLEQAVALDPTYAPAQHKLGLVRAQQQDYARAAQHFAAAVQADPALLAAHLDWATALEQLGRRDDALQVLTAAHKLARAQQPALIPDIQARLQRLSQP